MRERLPNRRENLTVSVPHPGTEHHQRPTVYDVALGFPAGARGRNPKEIFISCNKVATALDIAGRDIAILASIALQHGATLAELAGSISRDDHGQPQGVAGAVLDAAIAEMAS